MTGRRIIALSSLFLVSWGAAYAYRARETGGALAAPRSAGAADTAPSRDMLPGTHLVAYVLVSPACSVCRIPEVRSALGSVGRRLRAAHPEARSIRVVAVVVNATLTSGVEYINGLSTDRFDEVGITGDWRHDVLDRFVLRESLTVAAVPQIIVAQRVVKPTARESMSVSFGHDSVLKVIRGGNAVRAWIEQGVPLTGPRLMRIASDTMSVAAALRRQ